MNNSDAKRFSAFCVVVVVLTIVLIVISGGLS